MDPARGRRNGECSDRVVARAPPPGARPAPPLGWRPGRRPDQILHLAIEIAEGHRLSERWQIVIAGREVGDLRVLRLEQQQHPEAGVEVAGPLGELAAVIRGIPRSATSSRTSRGWSARTWSASRPLRALRTG